MIRRKLDARELLSLRLAARRKHKSPSWGDHVLHGRRGFTTAGKLVVIKGRSVKETV
jgi:hypothetical protein